MSTSVYLPSQTADDSETAAAAPLLAFADGTHAEPLPMALDALAPVKAETWHAPGPVERSIVDGVAVAESSDYLCLTVAQPTASCEIRADTRSIYQRLLRLTLERGYPTLVRFWNYVPDINAGEGDAEQYKQFCWGRAEAFDEYDLPLPAATGIGSHDGTLRVVLLAARDGMPLEHFENPRQVAAYRYPRQYGPRSPSFARATWLGNHNSGLLLVSGTASIVNHENRHIGDAIAQIEETARNIRALISAAEAARPATGPLKPSALRLYLREPQLLPAVLEAWHRSVDDRPPALVLRGDICRQALALEVEGVFAPAAVR
ncbi:MAG: pteridine-dependent deoxygenase like protein [Pseudomonadota bacterium]